MSTNDLKPAADAHASQRIELSQAQRIVVKVGSAMLTHPEDGLAKAKIAEYCAQLHGLKEAGREVVLVSSGCVMRLRPWRRRRLQAAWLAPAAGYGSPVTGRGGGWPDGLGSGV